MFAIWTNDLVNQCVASAQSPNSCTVYFRSVAFDRVGGRSLWSVALEVEAKDGLLFPSPSLIHVMRVCKSVSMAAALHRCHDE